MVAVDTPARGQAGVPLPSRATRTIPVLALGMSLSLFLAITYVLCVGFDLIFPAQAMHANWQGLLPGFTWLTWPSFVIGLIESFAYGWYVALIFGPLYNFFVMQGSAR
jgi:2TM family of unknown function (DUF5676)